MMKQALTYLEIKPQTTAKATVIWLHGLGGEANNFIDCAQQLNFPSVRFIFPQATVRPITLNAGALMPGWYDIYGLDINMPEDETGIKNSAQLINQIIKDVLMTEASGHKIILAGFSQGGAMALFCGLRYPETLAGVLALSTYLPLAHTLSEEAHPLNQTTSIFMAHGDTDNIVDVSLAEYSYNHLKKLNFNVEMRRYAMSHSICSEEMLDIKQWLVRMLNLDT